MAETLLPNQTNKSRWDDFKRPLNIISLSVAFGSIVLSIFFYYISQKSREPTYLVSDEIGKVYDSSISSPSITVLDKDSVAIQDDIFLTTATFWNRGEIPIEPEDVRKPVIARISPIRRILDYSIQEQTEPDVADIRLSLIKEPSPDSPSAEIQIDWTHLDPNHGVRFQIIYAGDQDAQITFDGSIVGVNRLQDGKPVGVISSQILSILIGILLAFLGNYVLEWLASKKKRKAILPVITIAVLIALIILIYMLFFRALTPPL